MIAANIRSVQANGPHHYGSEILSAGENPLHRDTDPADLRANRRAACGTLHNPAPGLFSCDESPFVTTHEGAAFTDYPDWGSTMVPVWEQDRQAVMIGRFYCRNRILEDDPFWVNA